MQLKHALLASVFCLGALGAPAFAQTGTNPPASHPAPAGAAMTAPQAADASNLIGRSIQNANNDTIGKIESVYIDASGKVDSVMVGVGGFLGVGEREVRLAWKDLHIADNGKKVTVDMTKDQLKAMPEYKYSDRSWRGHVFSDRGPWTADRRADQRAAADARSTADRAAADNRARTDAARTDAARTDAARTDAARTDADRGASRTESTGDFNVAGDMSGSAIIGTKVRNANRDTVGSVDDLYLDANGHVKSVVLSVGGFLGVGSKDVALKWSDIKYGRDGNSVVLTTDMTKDQLKALPDYKYERRKPADQQATAPAPERK